LYIALVRTAQREILPGDRRNGFETGRTGSKRVRIVRLSSASRSLARLFFDIPGSADLQRLSESHVSGHHQSGRNGRHIEPVGRLSRAAAPGPTADLLATVGQETKVGILLDTETTSLDHRRDELIELGMVKFDYTADGRIASVRDALSAFNEPSEPIPPDITALTGIMMAFVGDAAITIAHNSDFDRKFAERY
jgi:hypothetical protein